MDIKNIKNKKVFLRADMDVTLNKGKVVSDYRIKRCIPTILELLNNNNKVFIFTKLGRPKNKEIELSTKNLIDSIEKNLNEKVIFIDKLEDIKNANNNLNLFENTRFFEWEEAKNLEKNFDLNKFKKIFEEFDVYIDEAFAMSHRRETTNYVIPQIIKNIYLGKNYHKEIHELSKIRVGQFNNPSYFLLGGAKAETKIPMIEKLIESFNQFLIGGILPKEIKENTNLNEKYSQEKLYLSSLKSHTFDISDEAVEYITNKIINAKTIVWNGPTGMFEKEKFSNSTKKLIKAIEQNNDAYKIAGGGDTIAAIEKFGSFNNYTFVSTGGGAMFNYLSGGKTNIEELIIIYLFLLEKVMLGFL